MLRQIEKTADKYNMLAGCETLVAAVSGGADSMCMLFLLSKLCKKKHIRLVCAHFDHELRGEDSDSDRIYVKQYCEKNNIEVVIGSGDVKKYALDNKMSIELAARELRYRFLYSVADKYEKSLIATAHTANDNAETVLFNLSRGTSLKGLCGIPPVRDRIIRPVIEFKRQDTEKCCIDNEIHFVTDKTNYDTVYSRNKIRIEVLPVLESVNAGALDNICRMTDLLRRDSEYIQKEAQKFYEKVKFENYLLLSLLKYADSAILSRIVILFLKENYSGEYDGRLIDSAEILIRNGNTGSKLQISGNTFFIIEYDKLYIKNIENKYDVPDSVSIDAPGVYRIGNYLITISENIGEKKNNIDSNSLKFPAVLCTPRQGDIFELPKVGHKLLRRILTDKKIPRDLRTTLPVVKYNDEIVWVKDIGVSAKFKPNLNTKQIYNIAVKETEK